MELLSSGQTNDGPVGVGAALDEVVEEPVSDAPDPDAAGWDEAGPEEAEGAGWEAGSDDAGRDAESEDGDDASVAVWVTIMAAAVLVVSTVVVEWAKAERVSTWIVVSYRC